MICRTMIAGAFCVAAGTEWFIVQVTTAIVLLFNVTVGCGITHRTINYNGRCGLAFQLQLLIYLFSCVFVWTSSPFTKWRSVSVTDYSPLTNRATGHTMIVPMWRQTVIIAEWVRRFIPVVETVQGMRMLRSSHSARDNTVTESWSLLSLVVPVASSLKQHALCIMFGQ